MRPQAYWTSAWTGAGQIPHRRREDVDKATGLAVTGSMEASPGNGTEQVHATDRRIDGPISAARRGFESGTCACRKLRSGPGNEFGIGRLLNQPALLSGSCPGIGHYSPWKA